MLFARHLNSLICMVLLYVCSGSIFGKSFVMKYEGQCGGTDFLIKIFSNTNTAKNQFVCYYKTRSKKKTIFYKPSVYAALHIACIKNNKKEDVVLIKEHYGGNSGPEDIYGIFDPKTKKLLLKPSDWPEGNSQQVQKILGYLPVHDDIEEKYFCCAGWASRYVDQVDVSAFHSLEEKNKQE